MPSPSTQRTSRIKHIFDMAARLPAPEVILTANSLQLLGAQQRFPDAGLPEFVEWHHLQGALPELFAAYWLPFTEDRRRMVAAIEDWRLGGALCDALTAVLVDPIERTLRSGIAKQWLLLGELHINHGVPLPKDYHVVAEAMQRVEAVNPPTELPNGFKTILARANTLSLEGFLGKGMTNSCPPATDTHHRNLDEQLGLQRSVVRGILGCLLDEELPKKADYPKPGAAR